MSLDQQAQIVLERLPEPKAFVTLKEAAHYLGVSYHVIWRRLGTGDGPQAKRVGRQWRLPKEEFLEWADQPVIK